MPNTNGKILDKLTSKNIIYILLIGFLCISLCMYDLRWIIPSIVLYIITIIYTLWVTGKKKNEIEKHIKDVTSDVDTASRGNLVNTPIPLVLIETNGNIIWRSKKFVAEFQNIDIGTYLNPIVKEIKLDLEKNEDESIEITKQFNIDKKIYKIRGSVVKAKRRDKKKQKEYILSLYFLNETKYNELFDSYVNSRPCIGIAIIDNYEDIIQRILPEKKMDLLAKIEREIIDWVTRTGGLIIKTERDSFIYVFEQQYLAEFEKEKFNILDKIKDIDSRDIQITLSIAISTDGNTNYEKYKSALAAMEIVLGRGGDQAVVRKDGKYKFYGGKTLEVEKRTKVKARTISQSISRIIGESDNVIIMGHRNIDIDAFGSALGLYRLSKTLGKDCYIASEPNGKSLGKFLDKIKNDDEYKDIILNEEEATEIVTNNTLLIVVDTHKTSYVEFPELLSKIVKNKHN